MQQAADTVKPLYMTPTLWRSTKTQIQTKLRMKAVFDFILRSPEEEAERVTRERLTIRITPAASSTTTSAAAAASTSFESSEVNATAPPAPTAASTATEAKSALSEDGLKVYFTQLQKARDKNSIAVAVISSFLPDTLVRSIDPTESAHSLWTRLERQFETLS